MTYCFNIPEAKDRFEGDRDLYVEVGQIFIEDATKTIEILTQAVGAKEWKQVNEFAHSMKGALLNLAAKDAAASALLLERCSAKGGVDCDPEELVRNLRSEFKKYIEDFNKFCQDGSW